MRQIKQNNRMDITVLNIKLRQRSKRQKTNIGKAKMEMKEGESGKWKRRRGREGREEEGWGNRLGRKEEEHKEDEEKEERFKTQRKRRKE